MVGIVNAVNNTSSVPSLVKPNGVGNSIGDINKSTVGNIENGSKRCQMLGEFRNVGYGIA